jgi:GNAT superfamily N-acetyltransferase
MRPVDTLSSVIVRDARADELPAVVECYDWLFDPPGIRPPDWHEAVAIARLQAASAGERSAVLVTEAARQIVGFCTIYLDIMSVRFGQRCWIEDLAVHPDWRSRGVGAALMDAAAGWATAHGASHLELDSSDLRVRAHQFYERRRPSWTSRCFGWVLPAE